MKSLSRWLALAMACGWPCAARAQLQLAPDRELPRVFAGMTSKVNLVWRNPGTATEKVEIRARLLQTAPPVAAPLAEKPWKTLEILPGQTVLESAPIDLPEVNAETRFLIQWVDPANRVLGRTEILGYPANLLGELKSLMGDAEPGVLDPNNELKPLLKQNHLEFVDLGEAVLDDFEGRLAIVGPFSSRAQMREGLAQAIQTIARKGTAVIWLQPPPGPRDELKPSFYTIPEGKGRVLVAQSELVEHPAENPKSQLNLIYFCKLALSPTIPTLPRLQPDR
jgi:hypothetical protein